MKTKNYPQNGLYCLEKYEKLGSRFIHDQDLMSRWPKRQSN